MDHRWLAAMERGPLHQSFLSAECKTSRTKGRDRDRGTADGIERNGTGPGEDATVLYREGRVWAARPGMKLDNERPMPLALFPAPCAWRQLAQERLQNAGRRWT